MHIFMSGVATILICAAFGMADVASGAPIGRGGAFYGPGGLHAGFHGHRGFYGGLYPYSLFGYPHSWYGGYYPYSIYVENEPDCDFVWAKRTAKRKSVRGIWTCS
jgi:hypothetical protein